MGFLNFLIVLLLVFSGNNIMADTTNGVGVSYEAHVQNIGWQNWVNNGAEAGTEGQSLRIEALKIKLINAPEGAQISYEAHVQNVGWQNWISDGGEAGTDGKSFRVEALKIKLTNMPDYTVQYQTYVQNIGWQNWVSDGAEAGTDGKSLRIEALRIRIVKKIQSITLNKTSDTIKAGTTDTLSAVTAPTDAVNQNLNWTSSNTSVASVDSGGKITGITAGSTVIAAATDDGNVKASCSVTVTPGDLGVSYETHVQNIGWQDWVSNGVEAGTDGKSLRIEALRIKLLNAPEGAGISYEAHVQNVGWQSWVSDGAEAGTDGKSFRVEALKIKLVGMPDYSVQYQAHVQNVGWQNWVSDGAEAGTDGKSLRVEAIRIRIVKKVQSIVLNKTSDDLKVGDSDTLTTSISPSDASDANLIWESSNPSIASVDSNGKVTGVSDGNAVITAETEDGSVKASCNVNVQKVQAQSITLNKTSDTLNFGGSDTLTVNFNPTDATNKNVTWTTSDDSSVKVDANGKITAVGSGTAVITVTTQDGNKTASCGVSVLSATDTKYNSALDKAKSVLSSIIKPGMSTVDKELAIHDYIVANTDYATEVYNNNTNVSDDVYTAYGVLIDRKAVCEGYARAFKIMCDLESIPCRFIADYNPLDHAWNEVKLDDGNYYQVDTTWDDPVKYDSVNNLYVPGDSVEHTYFNLSDKQIFSDHPISQSEWATYNNPQANIDSSEFYAVADVSHDSNVVFTNYNSHLCSVDSSDNIKTISYDNAQNINYYNGYIYYTVDSVDSSNNVTKSIMYMISPNGGGKVKLAVGKNITKMYLYNGAVYYLDAGDFSIHKLVLDGSYNNNTIIGYSWSSNFYVSGSSLYYSSNDDEYIHKVDLTTLQNNRLMSVTDYNLQVYGNYIFYKNSSSIYRSDLNGGGATLILNGVSDFIDAAINHIYYEANNIWYKSNLDGSGLSSMSF
ncbi:MULTISPECIES: Ig-like domain-containing protein [Clostridium]|uniref:Ig-like domain-containing protein n=1 Tax=Clostridium sp. CT7 TaxID=2052574 RepID=UPI001FA7DB24|nr:MULTISPECIES: Ig-like domain-containing protein [Clostridium]